VPAAICLPYGCLRLRLRYQLVAEATYLRLRLRFAKPRLTAATSSWGVVRLRHSGGRVFLEGEQLMRRGGCPREPRALNEGDPPGALSPLECGPAGAGTPLWLGGPAYFCRKKKKRRQAGALQNFRSGSTGFAAPVTPSTHPPRAGSGTMGLLADSAPPSAVVENGRRWGKRRYSLAGCCAFDCCRASGRTTISLANEAR
jgi:hypothetical protein